MSAESFLKCLAVMTASLVEKDVTNLKSNYQMWEASSASFLKGHAIYKQFSKHSKDFLASKMEMDEDASAAVAADLKSHVPKLVADTSITQEQLGLFKSMMTFFRTGSTPSWNAINKNITILGEHSLSALFLPDDEDDGEGKSKKIGDLSTFKKMVHIVQKVTGRANDAILTLNENRELAESNPKLSDTYKELRKRFVANYKKALMIFIRKSGKPYVDVKIVRKYLEAMGCNYIPKGFVGSIDDQGRLYTTAGHMLANVLVGEVVMNPKYDAKADNTYVCYLKSQPNLRARTVRFTQANRSARFEKVHSFIEGVDTHRTKWIQDLKSLDSRVQTIATMVETIYQTQARIGGTTSTNKDNEDRYGMSTLLVSHVTVSGNTLKFKYPGKKGTLQTHTLTANSPTNRVVVAAIKELMRKKKPTDHVFTHRGKRIAGQEVNKYLKSLGVDVSIHKFRHLAGTKLAMEILKKAPFKKDDKPSQSSVEKWVKEEMKQVGELLHHRTGSGDNQKVTGMTAINAYVSPDLMKQFFGGLGLRVPKWVPKT